LSYNRPKQPHLNESRLRETKAMNRFRALLVATSIGVVLALAGVAMACPTCGEGLMQADPHAQSIAAGYKYSIIFMVTMPYLCLGTLASIAYYSIHRARTQQQAADAEAFGDQPTDG
jgi:Na+-driven multidrug efflux pump